MSKTLNSFCALDERITQDQILFRQISQQISCLGEKFGVTIVPFHDSALIHFSKMSPPLRTKTLESLKTYLQIYTLTLAEGASALDSGRVIWNALAQLGYKPTSDVFSFIQNGNIIEIYDNSFVQIFRSINFFNLCSYSLEDLYCHQITELYERDLQLESSMMNIVTKIYSGEIKSTVLTGLQPHIIQEKMSKNKLRVMGHIKYISPLYFSQSLNDLPQATLGIESAELSNEMFERNPAAFLEKNADVIPLGVVFSNASETRP